MIEGHTVLAIVPARSGSKGIRDKNMAVIGGLSLIARAANVLSSLPWIDRKVISTDAASYAKEARVHGLEAPFLRPVELSGDNVGALETIVHALETCEHLDRCTYSLVILAEPTSPLREASDIESTVRTLLRTGADSAITVSRIDTKNHPEKIFEIVNGVLSPYAAINKTITQRQQLGPLYWRNGLCYCFRRNTLLVQKTLITRNTVPILTDRPVANIDEELDLLWAQFLFEKTIQNRMSLQ
jgi:CMP-N,N'-diacetyllegionaminic acid synthase